MAATISFFSFTYIISLLSDELSVLDSSFTTKKLNGGGGGGEEEPMFSILLLFLLFLLFALSLLSLFLVTFSICRNFHRKNQKRHTQNDPSVLRGSLSKIAEKAQESRENDPTHLTHSLLFGILPSDSAKWGYSVADEEPGSVTGAVPETGGSAGDQGGSNRKKKKRAKKKRLDLRREDNENGQEKCTETESSGSDARVRPELVCLYPFTSTSSATQRKIKQQYDQLVKCHETKGLTLAQVGEFANCLIEARNELQHKSEIIKRRFTITKALLFKADRSSFERIRQQIYKLEMEQKRLEEDAFVYNWLQQQLKLSPAYKKMLEIGACMEMKAKSSELVGSTDSESEFTDISFEELLAQEKKDSFWQKNGRSRTCSSR
ncbi:uncharacterized protein LOC110818350 [Carica papaya]|uniref:uncharacterized protein LOC110818350 n=1 Tax=Carica papaya TaxID=3649 RepID=UPI000B8CA480|nr:uncharacterized protein LOC110818350 [Carica papaya]